LADDRRGSGRTITRAVLYVVLAAALVAWIVSMGNVRNTSSSWISGVVAGTVLVGLGAGRRQGWGNSAGWGMSTSRAILYVILMTVGIVVTVLGITFAEISVESNPHPSSDYLVATFILVALVIAGGIALIALPASALARSRKRYLSRPATPAVAAAPSKPAAQGLAAGVPADSDAVAQIVLRSKDVSAVLKDLLAHDDGTHAPLPALLRNIGLSSWEGVPVVSANRLARNNRYWLLMRDEYAPEVYDRFVTLEAALNMYGDIRARNAASGGRDTRPLGEQVLGMLAATVDLEPATKVAQGVESEFVPTQGGEWAARKHFADFAESVPTTFRFQFSMQTNLDAGVFLLEVEVPRPACFSIVSPDEVGRVSRARAYALRVALLGAHGAFEAGRFATVVVNCREHGSEETVLSLRLDATTMSQLRAVASSPGLDEGGFPQGEAVRASFGENGWFVPVEPFLTSEDPTAFPASRYREVELDASESPAELAEATGAHRICDLGIYEVSPRVSKWHEMVANKVSSTGEAVSMLMAARDATTDVTVAEACNRAARALVDGTMDVTDTKRLGELFINGDELSLTVARIRNVISDEEHLDGDMLTDALASLDKTLGPITDMGMYLDDTDNVYRYFNSFAERVYYNRILPKDARTTRLVPDAYYVGHSEAARILNLLERYDEALVHDEELVRIAPATPDALLAKVRTLEEQGSIFEAADLLKKAILISSTSRDLCICFYRLAFMEWKLGEGQLAVACYVRSMGFRSDVARQAQQELEELIATEPQLKKVTSDEAREMIKAAGLPYGDVPSMRRTTAACACACTDANLIGPARAFTEMLLDLNYDDALVDVCRSLAIPRQ
jgi:tetratricopeptide (TPR) repeat protein